jgi:hypothetical protein
VEANKQQHDWQVIGDGEPTDAAISALARLLLTLVDDAEKAEQPNE